jgi:ABC-type Na+ efflux pump permease subunit
MPAPNSPPWTRRYARASYTDPGLRVSDAERTEVADRLSKHYSDGRLNEAEFNERLDQAMSARTRSDLSGIFADLPELPATGSSQPPAGRERAHPLRRVLFLVLVIAIAAMVGNALAHSVIPWVLIGLLVFLWWRHGPSKQRRQ